MNDLLSMLALGAMVGAGLIAGVFFAFSNFVMRALLRVPPAHGHAAMQAINVTVLNPVFLGVFAGTALLSLAVAVLGLLRWGDAGAPAFVLGGGL